MSAPRIIVVEDERIVALHLKQQLVKLGYEVTAVVASGEAALAKIAEATPDLVLMDIHIEGELDGIETVHRIPPELHIPVIYVTAYSEEATLDRVRDTRPYGFLVKPYSDRELHATIQIALERHRVDTLMRQSERRFRQVVDAMPGAILIVREDGSIDFVNTEAERMFGFARAALIGQPVERLLPEADRKGHAALRAGYLNAPQARAMGGGRELHGRRSDGSDLPVEIGLSPIDTPDGPMVLAAVVDISERKRADQVVRDSVERLQSIFAAVTDGVFIVDFATGVFSEVNDAAAAMLGYRVEDLIGLDVQAISSGVPPYTGAEAREWHEKARSTGVPQQFDWQCKARDGRLFWAEVSVRFAMIGGRQAVLAVVRDITRRHAVEAQLRQALKMEAIGLLTGGIAHDFNNLLAIIQGNLELIRERASADAEIDEMAGDALRTAGRGASLTHQLLAYARQQPLLPKAVCLHRLVSDMVQLLRRTLGEAIEIRAALPTNLWNAMIDGSQLENALVNLAVNARDAMPGGGKLTIEAANEVLDETHAEQNPEVTPGDYVRLAVTDNGTGMSPAVMAHVLEPFYTTKGVGQGSGLGLSMVFGFVKQSGGHLRIYSEVGRGTTIFLYLPRARSAPIARSAAPATDVIPRSRGDEVVLVLEDDVNVRRFALRVLGGLGYRTIEASDGPDALRILDGPDRIDLLLTDVGLPKGMTGPEVSREAQARRPGLKVLYMSGYAMEAIFNNGVLESGMQLLTKPFPKVELARKVREILDSGGTP